MSILNGGGEETGVPREIHPPTTSVISHTITSTKLDSKPGDDVGLNDLEAPAF